MENKMDKNYEYFKLRRLLRDAGLSVDQAHALARGIESESSKMIKTALDGRFRSLFEVEYKEELQRKEVERRELDELVALDRQVSAAMSDPMQPAGEPFSREELKESLKRIRSQEGKTLSAADLQKLNEKAARGMCLPGDDWKDLI